MKKIKKMQKESPDSDRERRRETLHFLISFPNQDYDALKARNNSEGWKRKDWLSGKERKESERHRKEGNGKRIWKLSRLHKYLDPKLRKVPSSKKVSTFSFTHPEMNYVGLRKHFECTLKFSFVRSTEYFASGDSIGDLLSYKSNFEARIS